MSASQAEGRRFESGIPLHGCEALFDLEIVQLKVAVSTELRWYGCVMNAVRGRVRGGHVELEGELPEGADVVVLATEGEEPFELAEAEVAELAARMAAANRREVVPAVDVIQKLRSSR